MTESQNRAVAHAGDVVEGPVVAEDRELLLASSALPSARRHSADRYEPVRVCGDFSLLPTASNWL